MLVKMNIIFNERDISRLGTQAKLGFDLLRVLFLIGCVPNAEFGTYRAMGGGAGEAMALGYTSEVLSGEVFDAGDNSVDAVLEVFGFVLNKAKGEETKFAQAKLLIFEFDVDQKNPHHQ